MAGIGLVLYGLSDKKSHAGMGLVFVIVAAASYALYVVVALWLVGSRFG
jgi:hypothetical protein